MQPENLKNKPEQLHPIPAPDIQRPLSDSALYSQANKAVDELTKPAAGARHQLGRGVPRTSVLLGG
jgi:hypothetical protein